jgi:hypothetical protein
MPTASEPKPKTRSQARPSGEKKSLSPQTPQPKAKALEAVIKRRWKALSDIING